jgi:hypothetical protein
VSGNGRLRATLEQACSEHGLPLKDLTVLAVQNDPFRCDTPTGHAEGAWLAGQIEALGLRKAVHLRALHYRLIGRPKPNGSPYTNTDPDWAWLGNGPGKAGRWLGYVGFNEIVDARNEKPLIQLVDRDTGQSPVAWVSISGLRVELPAAADLEPYVLTGDFHRAQLYRLAYFGEKTSLSEVLSPVAARLGADLFLPTDEISDTMVHDMAEAAAEDGRPLVVLTFSDSDPSGWQMPISIGRKLQALKALKFPDLEFQVRRVGLLPSQVREYGLPSTPLKDTERRADRWMAATGTAQTEIDALLALRPDLLRDLAIRAAEPFYDRTLYARCSKARDEWRRSCQAAVDEQTNFELLDRLAEEAQTALDQIRAQVEQLSRSCASSREATTCPTRRMSRSRRSTSSRTAKP